MEDEPQPSGKPGTTDVVGDWRNDEFVRLWHTKDEDIGDRLAFPRALTAGVVTTGPDAPEVIIDNGSGPGAYLAVLLEAVPQTQGVWVDASEPMLEIARERLAPFGDRVTFHVADMREISRADLPAADVVVSSRAAHHLTYAELLGFYRASFDLLRPGGWIANLDHTEPSGEWAQRYKVVGKRMSPPKPRSVDLPPHRHDHARPTVAENLSALSEAGFEGAELVWKAFHTCLFMATKH